MVHAELTVAAVVRRDARFLVVEESVDHACVINQPADHVEAGESIPEAVVRETREETAWDFIPTGVVGLYYWPHDDGRIILRVAFCGELNGHDGERALDDDIVAVHWLSADDLARRANLRSPLVLKAIDDYTRYAPWPLERLRHVRA